MSEVVSMSHSSPGLALVGHPVIDLPPVAGCYPGRGLDEGEPVSTHGGSAEADWPLQQGAAFETALEVLAGLIAFAGQKISVARAASDQAAVHSWAQRRDEWTRRRLALAPTDAAAIQTVLEQDGPLLRQER